MKLIDKIDQLTESGHPADGLWQKVTKNDIFVNAALVNVNVFISAEIGFLHRGGAWVFRIKTQVYGVNSSPAYMYGPSETYESEKEAQAAAKKFYNSDLKKDISLRK